MSTQRVHPESEEKRPRPTPEERARLLAEMKKDFDDIANDPEKMKREQDDRDFWNHVS